MRSGVLYQSGGKTKGQLSVSALVFKLKTIAWALRKSGAALMVLAGLGLVWLYYPLASAEIGYSLAQIKLPEFNIPQFPKTAEKPSWTPVDSSYSIYIPKIAANARVVPDVDINSESAYLVALKSGVAAVAGLSHPGQLGTTYLFAHSTNSPVNFARYNAIFYLLGKLKVGDEVEMMYKSKLYKYKVSTLTILEANDTRYLIPQNQKELLVLQTCWPPGTSWKRLVVEAKPVY